MPAWGPLTPAHIAFDADGTPLAPDFGDVYHARAGALAQARQVFLAGNGLPERWAGQARFTILETGFGLGHNFLATWAAWAAWVASADGWASCACCARPAQPGTPGPTDGPTDRPTATAQAPAAPPAGPAPLAARQLTFVSIEKHPPTRADLARALAIHRHDTALAPLAAQLLAAWPPATPDMHLIDLPAGPGGATLRLQLAFGDIAHVLPQLVLQADAFYLDGFAPAKNPAMWDTRLLATHLARLAAPGATAATWSVAAPVRQALQQAGFEVHKAEGFGGKRQRLTARFTPRHRPAPPPGRRGQPGLHQAVVVGAGLAGAAAARALAQQGVQVLVLDRQSGPAMETSGNPGGLFHATLHAQDGPHARWLRAAALYAERLLRPLTARGTVPGQVDGLLRGGDTGDTEDRGLGGASGVQRMRALLARSGLPADFVQVLADAWPGPDTGNAHPAWLYPGGGWVSPAALARHWLDTPGIARQMGRAVAGLQPEDDQDQPCAPDQASRWRLLDAQGRTLAQAAAVVLANADQATHLLGQVHPALGPAQWPLGRRRGQTTVLPPDLPGLPTLPLPVATGSYALRLQDGQGGPQGPLLCGATQQPGDDDPRLRADDHAHNLTALARLTGWQAPLTDAQLATLPGRVGWRLVADDRLPLVGPVPHPAPSGHRLEQPRNLPRLPGLWLLTALGSRGITQAALAGEVLAAWMTGAPVPLPSDLVDAIDPARFAARARRRPPGLSRS